MDLTNQRISTKTPKNMLEFLKGKLFFAFSFRARKMFEFDLTRWASNPQILLARGTSKLAQVFKVINNL